MRINEMTLRRLVLAEFARRAGDGDDEGLGSGDNELDRAWEDWTHATRALVNLLDEDGTLLRSDVLLMMHDHLKRCRS
jgi:hypothetical protein